MHIARRPPLTMGYWSEMSAIFEAGVQLADLATRFQRVQTSHVLDMWIEGQRKVFSIRQDDTGLFEIVRFSLVESFQLFFRRGSCAFAVATLGCHSAASAWIDVGNAGVR